MAILVITTQLGRLDWQVKWGNWAIDSSNVVILLDLRLRKASLFKSAPFSAIFLR